MAKYVTKVRTNVGDLQIDYNALANVPKSDETLSQAGSFADAKAVGNKFNEVNTSIESISNNVATMTPESIGAVNSNKVANNVTTTTDGYVLDARQGAVLNGKIDSANSQINSINSAVKTCESNITKNSNAIASKISMTTSTAVLPKGSWSNHNQTVSVNGVTSSNVVIVTSAPANYTEYNECCVRCSGQASGKLTFTCTDVPSSTLTANILILN